MTLKSARRGEVSPFIVMELLRFANQRVSDGGHVLHLELGEPSAPTPLPVVARAHELLDKNLPGYTESLGIPPLRERIAAYYREREGIAVTPGRIAVTTGSSGAFVLAFLAAFDVGDRVALAMPGYPAYRNILSALGIEPVALEVGSETRFQPTVGMLEQVEGPLDGLIIASPSNPTGTVLPREEFCAIADHCRDKGIRLVSDEIYHGITFGGFGAAAISALSFTDEAIIINSFSKYFAMPGWRLGWMVVPEDLLRAVESLSQNLFISPPCLSQHVAINVFDCLAELDTNVTTYARNRAILLEGLPQAGFDRLAPSDGAFYLYADVSELTNDSHDFCHRMLAETGVATTPGMDFDYVSGHRAIRLSFAGPAAAMEEAVARLKDWKR